MLTPDNIFIILSISFTIILGIGALIARKQAIKAWSMTTKAPILKNTKSAYNVPLKERLRRFEVRLKTLFNIPEYRNSDYFGKIKLPSNTNIPVKIPNFWYTPFEVYLLAHLQRAHFIMTCDEYFYVDSWAACLATLFPKKENSSDLFDHNFFAGTIEMHTRSDSSLAVKKTNGKIKIIRENETKTDSNN
jgi:hypothetical protein